MATTSALPPTLPSSRHNSASGGTAGGGGERFLARAPGIFVEEAQEAMERRPTISSRDYQRSNRYNRKIAVMGYPGVGKSSITLRFVSGTFPDGYQTTIEDLHSKEYKYRGREYELRITDTAGQQEYSIFPRSCSVDVDGFILVYAIDDRKSFEIIQTIHDKIVESCGDRSVPVVVVGNKLDLQYLSRQVPSDEGEAQARLWNAYFVEISAKELAENANGRGARVVAGRDRLSEEELRNRSIDEVFDRMILAIELAKGNIKLEEAALQKKKNCSIS